MFTGYNLVLEKADLDLGASGEAEAKYYNEMRNNINNEISEFINKDGTINAIDMQKEWFPDIQMDIFISHSSKDKDLAISLAIWLEKNFGLKAFIDSCVWGYCDELLKKIDDKYCCNGEHTYNYLKRNYSTSHVHNMLSTALNTMLDKCECVFFLNTDNSIKNEEDIFDFTESPWIYNELSMIKTIRKNVPDYVNGEIMHAEKSRKDSLYESRNEDFPKFKYRTDLSGLIQLENKELIKWKNGYNWRERPLLSLYKETGALENYMENKK